MKVVLLHLWRVNVKKTIGGFINIPLADSSHINLRHKNITVLQVGRESIIFEELVASHFVQLYYSCIRPGSGRST